MNYQRAAAVTRQARSHAQHKREQSYKRMDGALTSEPQPILKRCWWCKLATPEYLIQRWIRSQDLPQNEHNARPKV